MNRINTPSSNYNPIIIGGLGGSGTRVVANILQKAGIFMGRYVNSYYDNLLFYIFGSPSRFHWSYDQIEPCISLFAALSNGHRLSLRQWLFLLCQLSDMQHRKDYFKTIYRAVVHGPMHKSTSVWGWKSGANQFQIPKLEKYFPQCFYIHTIRNGLDMAFSENTRQLHKWAHLLEWHRDNLEASIPQRQLALWVSSNKWVNDYCNTHLPGRHFILRFEDLCQYPDKVISDLFTAIGIQSSFPLSKLADLVEPPASIKRYQNHDISQFSPELLNSVIEFGYNI